jgi:hypothetical protein
MIQKPKLPRMRGPDPTKKESEAWALFLEIARQFPGKGGLSLIAAQELERLASKGNPLAVKFREKLSQANYRPRAPDDPPAPAPAARRIRNVRWVIIPPVD